MVSTQDRQPITCITFTIHTSIRILYIGIRSRYKIVPHPTIRLENGADLDQYTRPDPPLPNLIILYYLFFFGLRFTPPPTDHTLSSANTWHAHGTVHCTLNPRVNFFTLQVCPGYIGVVAPTVLLHSPSTAASPTAPLVSPVEVLLSPSPPGRPTVAMWRFLTLFVVHYHSG